MFLSNTLADPDNVPAFLLLQLQVRIENTKVELLQKSENIEVDLKQYAD